MRGGAISLGLPASNAVPVTLIPDANAAAELRAAGLGRKCVKCPSTLSKPSILESNSIIR